MQTVSQNTDLIFVLCRALFYLYCTFKHIHVIYSSYSSVFTGCVGTQIPRVQHFRHKYLTIIIFNFVNFDVDWYKLASKPQKSNSGKHCPRLHIKSGFESYATYYLYCQSKQRYIICATKLETWTVPLLTFMETSSCLWEINPRFHNKYIRANHLCV